MQYEAACEQAIVGIPETGGPVLFISTVPVDSGSRFHAHVID
jgi:hypothetical protein